MLVDHRETYRVAGPLSLGRAMGASPASPRLGVAAALRGRRYVHPSARALRPATAPRARRRRSPPGRPQPGHPCAGRHRDCAPCGPGSAGGRPWATAPTPPAPGPPANNRPKDARSSTLAPRGRAGLPPASPAPYPRSRRAGPSPSRFSPPVCRNLPPRSGALSPQTPGPTAPTSPP